MHKKFLAAGLPILGATVIVGAGFSAWLFGGETSATVGGSIQLAGTYGFTTTVYRDATDTSTALSSFSITLDQGSIGVTDGAGHVVNTVDIVLSFDGSTPIASGTSVGYAYGLSLSGSLDNYLDLGSTGSVTLSGTYTGKGTEAQGTVLATIEDVPFTFAYASGFDTTNASSYQSLSSVVSAGGDLLAVTVASNISIS